MDSETITVQTKEGKELPIKKNQHGYQIFLKKK